MAYCIIGIPMVFCFVALLADSLSSWHTLLVSTALRHCLGVDVDSTNGRRLVACAKLLALITWLAAVVVVSAFLVLQQGANSFSDGLYLVVITYTTVGYGDLNPYYLGDEMREEDAERMPPLRLFGFICMVCLGLCSVGTALAALQDSLQLGLDKTYQKVHQMFPNTFPPQPMSKVLEPPRDSWLCLVGYDDGLLRVWDMEEGSCLLHLDSGEPGQPQPDSPASAASASASAHCHDLEIADSATGALPDNGDPPQLASVAGRRLKHLGHPISCSFMWNLEHKTGKRVAVSAYSSGDIHAWSIAGNISHLAQLKDLGQAPTTTLSRSIKRPAHHVRQNLLCAEYVSCAGKDLIATGGSAGRLGFWELCPDEWAHSGSSWTFESRSAMDMEVEIRCLATMMGGGDLVAAGGYSNVFWGNTGTIALWDLAVMHQVSRMDGLKCGQVTQCVSIDHNNIATSHTQDNVIRIWDLRVQSQPRKPIGTLEGHAGGITALAATLAGSLVVSGSKDCMVALWDSRTWKPFQLLSGHGGPVTSLNVLGEEYGGGLTRYEGGSAFLSGSTFFGSSFLSTASSVNSGNGSTGTGLSCRHIVSGSSDGTMKLWERSSSEGMFGHRHTFLVPNGTNIGVTCSSVAMHWTAPQVKPTPAHRRSEDSSSSIRLSFSSNKSTDFNAKVRVVSPQRWKKSRRSTPTSTMRAASEPLEASLPDGLTDNSQQSPASPSAGAELQVRARAHSMGSSDDLTDLFWENVHGGNIDKGNPGVSESPPSPWGNHPANHMSAVSRSSSMSSRGGRRSLSRRSSLHGGAEESDTPFPPSISLSTIRSRPEQC